MDNLVLTGRVVHGKELGRTVGMPTANIDVGNQTLPKPGVYATRIVIGDRTFASVTNIGTRPSVDCEEAVTVETFVLDFDEDIYGETVSIEICGFLRPIQKFAGLEAVYGQVKKDIEEAKKC